MSENNRKSKGLKEVETKTSKSEKTDKITPKHRIEI
jgi:hypothetical protein